MMKTKAVTELVSMARIGFEEDVYRLMKVKSVSRAELSRRYGAARSRISRLLNGLWSNYTLESMAKIANALDAVLEVRLADEDSEAVRVLPFHEARFFDERVNRRSELAAQPTDNVVLFEPPAGYKAIEQPLPVMAGDESAHG